MSGKFSPIVIKALVDKIIGGAGNNSPAIGNRVIRGDI